MARRGWDELAELTETQQARFLVGEASNIWRKLSLPDDVPDTIRERVTAYLGLAAQILSGQYHLTPELLGFLEDPRMRNDFGSYCERARENDKAAAALDVASYACGFVCRISAAEAGIDTLPDPVLESTPDVFDYYRQRALLFN